MTRVFLLLMSLVLLSQSAYSAQLPRYLGSEKKFRSFVYNPNDVYRYIGHYTYQGFIEFDVDETISTISMGDPTLWLFESLANRLFLKPVGEDYSETNMTIITNKKVYHFELLAREAKGLTDPDLIFVVKFVYPDEKNKNLVQFPRTAASDEPDLRDLAAYKFNYQYTGEASIAPIRVFDNGEFTYFQFSKRNAEIPAIFTVDAEGFESLVNFRAAGDYIIVERVASQFTLRNGSDIVCVYNMDLYANGKAAPQSTLIRREDGPNTRGFPAMRPESSAAPMAQPPYSSPPPAMRSSRADPQSFGGGAKARQEKMPGSFF
jgi:type IV secretion system protein VirB9